MWPDLCIDIPWKYSPYRADYAYIEFASKMQLVDRCAVTSLERVLMLKYAFTNACSTAVVHRQTQNPRDDLSPPKLRPLAKAFDCPHLSIYLPDPPTSGPPPLPNRSQIPMASVSNQCLTCRPLSSQDLNKLAKSYRNFAPSTKLLWVPTGYRNPAHR